MEFQQVYIKTAKGQEEIQKRLYKLPASLRRLLIMVDGRSTAAEMIERLTSMGDIATALSELEAGGFIASLFPANKPPPAPVLTPATKPLPATDAPQSERMLLQNIWETGDWMSPSQPGASSTAGGTPQPRFNLDKAKSFIRTLLLATMGPGAGHWIDRVEATKSVEELRVELDAIREMLPKVLSKRQAEQTWKQLEPILLPFSPLQFQEPPAFGPASQKVPTATPVAQPTFNMDKAKAMIRFTLLGAMGPSAGRRIERIEAVTTVEALRVELEAIHEMLPKVLSKRGAEQAWKQLEPIILSIALPPL